MLARLNNLITKSTRNLLEGKLVRLGEPHPVDEDGEEVEGDEDEVEPPLQRVEGHGRDLRQPDVGHGHGEDGEGVAVAAQVLREDLGDEDPDRAVEEERVASGVEEDEGDAGGGAGDVAAVSEEARHDDEEDEEDCEGNGSDAW